MYNIDSFIERAKKTHGDKYDYSLVDYKNSKTKIKIICSKHGIFQQLPSKHLIGRGCPFCGGSIKKNNNYFVNESIKIHGYKYDYSLVDYKSMKHKVKIICPKHGVFEQKAESHLNGHICRKCYIENKKYDNDIFIEKSKEIHGDKYDYSLVEYKDSKTKVKIICPKHGIFEQNPSHHLLGQGCKFCADEDKKLTIIDFIRISKKVHGDEYIYYDDYINNYTKVKIICPKHGVFYQSPNYHMLGQGCPICNVSKLERNLMAMLDDCGIYYEQQKKFNDCKNINELPFDFYLPEHNVCIECNGKQHYEPIDYFGGDNVLDYIKMNDNIKKTFCDDNNIKLYIVRYDHEDDDINEIKKLL
jgi:hypothetical protein